jgi:hypothetical protein
MGSFIKILLNIVSIIVFFGLLYYALENLKREGFTNPSYVNIRFMTQQETKDFLFNDADEYVHTLNQWDLIARHVSIFQDYLTQIAKSAISFSENEKVRISNATKQADTFFKSLEIEGINCSKIASIPWVFAQTKGTSYEDGLPHTRANIIFISSSHDQTSDALIKTLIHEKIHLYQRIYPEETMQYLETNGYYRWKQRYGVPRIRSNPDLDPWIYFNPSTKTPMIALYASDSPQDIHDINIPDPNMEHPYEHIAYTISKKYKKI